MFAGQVIVHGVMPPPIVQFLAADYLLSVAAPPVPDGIVTRA